MLIRGKRSQGVSRGTHLLVDPGEIGLLAIEETRDGINQHAVGRSGVETASFFEGQELLHPVIALGTRRTQRALTPQHPKAQGPFHPVIGRLDAILGKKNPERIYLAEQAAGKLPYIVLPTMILVDQLAESGRPRSRNWVSSSCRLRT